MQLHKYESGLKIFAIVSVMFYNFTFAKKPIITGSIETAYLNMFNKLKNVLGNTGGNVK